MENNVVDVPEAILFLAHAIACKKLAESMQETDKLTIAMQNLTEVNLERYNCKWCKEIVSSQDPRVPEGLRPMHYECEIRSVVGSVGHQTRRCSCNGGTFEDPLEMTRREAAIAAAFLFLKAGGDRHDPV